MKKTNCGSTTREVFLFNHCRELSFLSQVYSVPFTLPWESGTSLISLDTFPRRRHFVIMDFFSRKHGNRVRNLEHCRCKKSICINSVPYSCLGCVWANILGGLEGESLQDNRLNSTERDRLTHSQISPNNSPPGCWGQIWASSRYKGHRREQELFLRFSKTTTRLMALCGEDKREDWEEEEV